MRRRSLVYQRRSPKIPKGPRKGLVSIEQVNIEAQWQSGRSSNRARWRPERPSKQLQTQQTLVCTRASAISMQRASWLLLSGLSTEAQQSMQHLPFDSQALFAEHMDSKLQGLKDSHSTLHTLGLYVAGPAHKWFTLQPSQGQRSQPWQEPPHKKSRGYKHCPSHPPPPSAQSGLTRNKQRDKQAF